MGFCDFAETDDGMFVLTLNADDGVHKYLTHESLKELLGKVKDIGARGRARPKSKGLVTTSTGGGSFCDGVDYGSTAPVVVDELVYLMAEVVRELYNMPFPTVAAVTGDVRTSLAMALVLAHDDIAAKASVKFELTEAQGCRVTMAPPAYFGLLLRDRAQYAGMRSSMVLRCKPMTTADMNYYSVYDGGIEEDDPDGVQAASTIITRSFCSTNGKAFITTRKSFHPAAWKAVNEFLAHQQ